MNEKELDLPKLAWLAGTVVRGCGLGLGLGLGLQAAKEQ